jgi:hypothetical protein
VPDVVSRCPGVFEQVCQEHPSRWDHQGPLNSLQAGIVEMMHGEAPRQRDGPTSDRSEVHTGSETGVPRPFALRAEIIAIERAFPELASPAGRCALRKSFKEAMTRIRTMSNAARKALSARMKMVLGYLVGTSRFRTSFSNGSQGAAG